MPAKNKFLHDHLILLLLSINSFLALAGSVFILLKLGASHSSSYIVQCRDCSNPSAINKFSTGSMSDILSLVIFLLVTLAITTALSRKIFNIHRQLSLTILWLGMFLLTLTAIIGNALLLLR